MARNKQKQLDEVGSFENVFENPFEMKGKWREYFGNDNPIVLELACGWGQYTLALAERYGEKNFIGVDKKGDRIWRGAKTALGAEMATGTEKGFGEGGMRNVAFLRVLIEKLGEFFEEGEVSEIWITFPDPHSKPCKAGKRLSSPRFLEIYKKVLKPGGVIHFKTDNDQLFEYTEEVLAQRKADIEEVIYDVHGMDEVPELLEIKTYFEKKFMAVGHKIKYLRFRL